MINNSRLLCRSGGYGHNIGCALCEYEASGTEARLSELDRAMQTDIEKVACIDDRDEGAVLATGARQSVVHEEGSAGKSFILRLFYLCSRRHFGFFFGTDSHPKRSPKTINRIECRHHHTFGLVASPFASQSANHICPPVISIQFNSIEHRTILCLPSLYVCF